MKHLNTTLVLCASFLLFSAPPPAVAQQSDEAPSPEAQGELVTRVYSLQDVLAGREGSADTGQGWTFYTPYSVTPAPGMDPMMGGGFGGGMEPEMGGMEGMPGGRAPVPPQSGSQGHGADVAQVMELLMTTIEPDSWRENGGAMGSISYLDWKNAIVVRHRPAVHVQIGELLETLAEAPPVITTQAMLVEVGESELADMTQMQGGLTILQESASADLPTVARVRLTGFDGEEQRAMSGRQVRYIEQVRPIVATSSVGYEPQMATVDEGFVISIQPRLTQGGEQITLAVDAAYTLVDGLSEPTTRPREIVVPDRFKVNRRSMNTRLRVPTGQWVLVGSLEASADGEVAEGTPLHLLIRIDAGARE